MKSLQQGEVIVELEHIGEGICGEYNPDDPEDMPLLRFTVFKLEEDGSKTQIENGSFCTIMPTETPDHIQDLGLKLIMEKVHGRVIAGQSIKRVSQELSWLSNDSYKDIDAIIGSLQNASN